MMLRILDVVLAGAGLILAFPLLVLAGGLAWLDTGSPLLRQVRVGRGESPFVLVKFRTMRLGTPALATHRVDPSAVTPWGRILRRSKLDELPQLWNVLRGDMSLVGPRPCLPGQVEVVRARVARRVLDVRPGVTGLSQIRGIDMSTPELLAATDAEMISSLSVTRYLGYILKTLSGQGTGDRVRSQSSSSARPDSDA